MKKIALTGGFATGKSTVGRMFEDLGLPRIDADVLVHRLMVAGSDVWNQIIRTFGIGILQNNREIDRKKLGEIVFADPLERKKLEAIVHPKVREALQEEIKRLEAKGGQKILAEIPLLFEVGWNTQEKWDAILVVTCDTKTQAERAIKKFGLTLEAAKTRIDAQMPLAEKAKQATFVIDNGQSLEQTKAQVKKIFSQI